MNGFMCYALFRTEPSARSLCCKRNVSAIPTASAINISFQDSRLCSAVARSTDARQDQERTGSGGVHEQHRCPTPRSTRREVRHSTNVRRQVAPCWVRGAVSSEIDSSQPPGVSVGSGKHQVPRWKVEPLQPSRWSRYSLPTWHSRGPSLVTPMMEVVGRPARAFKTSLIGPALPSGQSPTCSTTQTKSPNRPGSWKQRLPTWLRPQQRRSGAAARRTDTVGLVLIDIGNSLFVDIARGAESAAGRAQLKVLLANSDSTSNQAGQLSRALRPSPSRRDPADAAGRAS